MFGGERVAAALHRRHRLLAPLEERLARAGEADRARGALDERLAHRFFERLDGLAHGGGADPQAGRGLAKALLLRHRDEGDHAAEGLELHSL